ncbi:YihY/virulence factor BrkB family protein [Hymenobacter taeanensis]|uniref:YihY/virulence factor BrkB family protein n=1 Tax=Hymenobacter taeanensis TaxID=2735321 RepID=A0A6M6BL83_9BACT|nr:MULTISPECIES: YihY/virulence factor BrkB family protein [Hymenobacter]QJX48876.1 YihY/virulence factor BrkB family protein [Hymenobacter taeanensis]UOQ81611.1 YihY/virulence factor BrkB family protein [Hymenobacter sp. 5414T-23]
MTKVHDSAHHGRNVWTDFLILLRRAAREFSANDPLRLGAATAFFTTFALPPILIILIQIIGSLYSASAVRLLLLTKLAHLLGASAAGLVEQILQNVTNVERSRLVTWLGFTFLLFIATTLFGVIQNSLNQLWQIRTRRSTGRLTKILKERARSLSLLFATMVLSVVAFGIDAALAFLGDYIRDFDATFVYYLFQIANQLSSLLILAAWFAITFRNLSSAKVPRRAVLRGALLTAVLIDLGENVLGFLLVPRNLGPIYGPASSMVLVLLFVFYSAMIFYFGACFTKAYAHYVGLDIRPKKSAIRYKLVDVED